MIKSTGPKAPDHGASSTGQAQLILAEERSLVSAPKATFYIDDVGKYGITFKSDERSGLVYVTLTNDTPAVRSSDSNTTAIVLNHLRLTVGGISHAFKGVADPSAELVGCAELSLRDIGQSQTIEVSLGGKTLRAFTFDPLSSELTTLGKPHRLHSFDLRNFELQGERYLAAWTTTHTANYIPLVDLHSHFAGQVSSDTIISIAQREGIHYPASLLEQIGIEISGNKIHIDGNTSTVSIAELDQDQLDKLKAHMHVEPSQVITFEEMESIYKLRGPVVKRPEFFGEFLEDVARRYREQGVQYAELSISDIVGYDWIHEAHKHLPRIEMETGVKLRFLVGLYRHNPEEVNLETIEKLKFVFEHSPYIVGADFMGHETNSTLALRNQITNKDPYDSNKVRIDNRTSAPVPDLLVELREKNPHFQIRLHAGENPVHPENVREAILAGATRIGHGLYVDEQTIALAAEKGVIVEFNPGSNRALNNIDAHGNLQFELPIRRYYDAGVRVSFGSDGSIYHGGGKAETHVGVMAGLSANDLRQIAKWDLEYKQKTQEAFCVKWNEMIDRCIDKIVADKMQSSEISAEQSLTLREELNAISSVARSGPKYIKLQEDGDDALWQDFTQRVLESGHFGLPMREEFPVSTFDWDEHNTRIAEVQQNLTDTLEERGIRVWKPDQLNQFLDGRTPLLISGASAKSWPLIKDQAAVKTFLEQLVSSCDPNKIVFVTGATHFGVEEELHQLVTQRNQVLANENMRTFDILGTVVDETKPDELGPITDAVSLGARWYAKSGPLLRFVNDSGGLVIFIGGGNILNDEIQAAYNLNATFYLMNGPEGASTNKARIHPERAFVDFNAFLELQRHST